MQVKDTVRKIYRAAITAAFGEELDLTEEYEPDLFGTCRLLYADTQRRWVRAIYDILIVPPSCDIIEKIGRRLAIAIHNMPERAGLDVRVSLWSCRKDDSGELKCVLWGDYRIIYGRHYWTPGPGCNDFDKLKAAAERTETAEAAADANAP